jgi:hypothetical protein
MSGSFSFLRLRKGSAAIGVVLLALGALYGCFYPASFFEGYLTAFIFWVTIALGCLALLLLQNLTGGLWGMTLSRPLEAGMMTLPLCALFFVPILFGLPYLFQWVHPAGPEIQHLVHEKRAYLNVPFYLVRNVLYFLLLGALAVWLRGLGLRRDGNDPAAAPTLRKISGPALIVFVLLMNFASIDWIMSLKPQWYSSMLVVEFVAEQAVVALAWSILVLRCLAEIEPMRGALSEKVVHDLGKLLLGFTCFWTYVTFSEYLITWTGNLPHEVSWFADRSSPGWKAWAVLLVFVHFVFPLFCLIMTGITKNLVRLSNVAALMLLAHFVQTVWWIEPGFGAHFQLAWTGPMLILALGALWLSTYLRALEAVPLLPRELLLARPEELPA